MVSRILLKATNEKELMYKKTFIARKAQRKHFEKRVFTLTVLVFKFRFSRMYNAYCLRILIVHV